MPELSVRIVVKTQKPVVRAVLETFGSPYPDLSQPGGLTRTHEQRAQTLTQLSAVTAGVTPLGPRPLVSLTTAAAAQAPVLLQRREQKLTTPTEAIEWRLELRATET